MITFLFLQFCAFTSQKVDFERETISILSKRQDIYISLKMNFPFPEFANISHPHPYISDECKISALHEDFNSELNERIREKFPIIFETGRKRRQALVGLSAGIISYEIFNL